MSRKTAIKPSDKDIIYRRRDSRKTSKNDDFSLLDVVDLCIERRVLEPIQALTKAQGAYITAILENVITFGIGPAGTGKSYVVAGLAADMLREKRLIVLSFPDQGLRRVKNLASFLVNWKKNMHPILNPLEISLMSD